ncbi:hypothetical protein G6F65_015606 [Rhizopus arrhizus]|nr:hypothetical protein G6F65_015606 [Rhizopus arrhizus]
MGKPGQVEGRLEAHGCRQAGTAPGRQAAHPGQPVRQPEPAGNRRLLRALYLRLRAFAERALAADAAHRASHFGADRQEDGQDPLGPELGRRPGRGVQLAQPRRLVRGRAERDVLDVREHLHDVLAPPVRPLPEPGLCRQRPVRFHLQA